MLTWKIFCRTLSGWLMGCRMPDDGRSLLVPRPPSYWHDQAYRRPRRHDEMQKEFLDFLCDRRLAGLPDTELIDRQVEGDFPLYAGGKSVSPLSFVDAIEILDIRLERFVSAFELKPEIYSVSGIIRQVKAQIPLIWSNLKPHHFQYYIVVPATDPLLPDLRAEWPQTWAWGFKLDQGVDG